MTRWEYRYSKIAICSKTEKAQLSLSLKVLSLKRFLSFKEYIMNLPNTELRNINQ